MSGFVFTVVILFIVLGVLVFVHELGHYWAAKRFGVWVHRFSIGMGKPIKALSFRRGETEWAVSWLPLGGYVKMASREEDPSSSVLEGGAATEVPPDRVFEAKPVWQRMVIILAGVFLNAVFAWLIFTGLAWKNGRQYDPTTTIGRIETSALPKEAAALAEVPGGTRITRIDGHAVASWGDIQDRLTSGDRDEIAIEFAGRAPVGVVLHRDALAERAALAGALVPLHPPVIGSLTSGYPAAEAGMQVGDSITAIDGTPVTQWVEAVERIRAAAGKPLAIEVARGGARQTFTLTPKGERDGDSTAALVGKIGAGVRTPYRTERLSFVGAVSAGTELTIGAGGAIFRTFRGLATRKIASDQIGGPILIGQMAAEQARAGIEPLLAFMALISMNLAVVNLLPIPVLDGGSFLILLAEAVIRRPLPVRVREAVSLVGLAMVLLLMVVAFKNDIMRLLS